MSRYNQHKRNLIEEGEKAFRDGLSIGDGPYGDNTDRCYFWERGWRRAYHEANGEKSHVPMLLHNRKPEDIPDGVKKRDIMINRGLLKDG